jgi:hypothetical protein
MIKVKSKTDVITNSSTEVFILKLTSKEVEWLENKRMTCAREALKANKENKTWMRSLSEKERKEYTSLDFLLEEVDECKVVLAPCFTREGLLWGLGNKEDRKRFWVNDDWEYIRKIIGGKAIEETDEDPDFRSFNKWLAANMDWISEKMKDTWLMEVCNYDEKIYEKLDLYAHMDNLPKDSKVLFYECRH